EASVVTRILLVADADERDLQQLDDGRQDLLARKARSRHVSLHLGADAGEGTGEGLHAVELRLVAHRPPARMVAILLAAALVAPGRLQMAVRIRTDPHVAVGRRNGQG